MRAKKGAEKIFLAGDGPATPCLRHWFKVV